MKVTEGFSDLYSSVLVKMKSQRGFWDIVVGVKSDAGEENLITYTNVGCCLFYGHPKRSYQDSLR